MATFNITAEFDDRWTAKEMAAHLAERLIGDGLLQVTVKEVKDGEEAEEASWPKE